MFDKILNALLMLQKKAFKDCNFMKKRLQHRRFPVNITKFVRTAFFIEHLR